MPVVICPLPRPTVYHFFTTNQLLFPKETSLLFPMSDTTDQSTSSHLRALFKSALEDYETKTKITLDKHPLAKQLENCNSVESITAILQDQARAFGEFRGRDRIMKSIKRTVSFLYNLSGTVAFGDDLGLVCQKTLITLHLSDIVLQALQPAKAIQTGIGVLLTVCASTAPHAYRYDIRVYQAANGVIASYNAIVDLLESIEHFLKRLDIYTKVPPTPAMDEILVKIMVELISTLALATTELKQGRPSESLLADVFYYSVQRREIRKKTFWRGKGCRGRPTTARSTHP